MCATLRDEFNEPKKSVIGYIDATVTSSNRVVKDLIISREVAQDCEISFANYLYLILKINGQSSPNRPTTMARRQSPRQRVHNTRAPSPQTLSPTKVGVAQGRSIHLTNQIKFDQARNKIL